jgi:hypothetical protein
MMPGRLTSHIKTTKVTDGVRPLSQLFQITTEQRLDRLTSTGGRTTEGDIYVRQEIY